MSELRFDPIRKQWVVISPERGLRPPGYAHQTAEQQVEYCPFCPGNEASTAHDIRVIANAGDDTDAPWKIRVIPNKFPALKVEGELERHPHGFHDMMSGIGAHEIIIETPNHYQQLPDLSIDHFHQLLNVYRERYEDLSHDTRLRYVLVFRNHGLFTGSTVSHPHSQVIATPITPTIVATELASAHEHYYKKERCLFCDILSNEIADGARIVSISEHFVALCPYASRVPFEIHVLPRRHSHDFKAVGKVLMRALAKFLREVLERLRIGLDDPPYNMVIHSSPNVQSGPQRAGYWDTLSNDYHWHIEILPHPPQLAGFELGTGFFINPTPPETAAGFLREIQLNEEGRPSR